MKNTLQHKSLILGAVAMLVLLACGSGCKSTKPASTEKAKQYSFWPAAPDEPRIQFLVAFNSSADVTPAQSRMDEIMYGRPQILAIVLPYGVAMSQGKIYVCDIRSRGVTVLDLKQHLAKAVGVGGPMEIAKATDIAISPDGFKYVVDQGTRAIVVLDQEDRTTLRFALPDVKPVSVAVHGDELYIVDFTSKSVKVLNRATGEYLRQIGQAGPEEGQFAWPLTVRVDPKGVVVVGDVLRAKMLRFSRDGKFISAFGRPGKLPGDFSKPKHFSFDKNGYQYIADGGYSNVQVFDDEQKVVGYFGSAGAHPGAMSQPVGLYVDESPEDLAMFKSFVHPAFQAERLIVVTNQLGNQRVAVYAGGRLKPGKTLADIARSRGNVSAGTDAPTTRPTTQPDFMSGAPLMQRPDWKETPAAK